MIRHVQPVLIPSKVHRIYGWYSPRINAWVDCPIYLPQFGLYTLSEEFHIWKGEHDERRKDSDHPHFPANHPNDPMPLDKSVNLCATCHSGKRFGWEEWQVSAHYQRDMTCIVCHNAHAASIKSLPDVSAQQGESKAASQLCINCHKEYAMDFPYSVHQNQGLNCVDCHLRPLDTSAPSAHAIPDHSFAASVSACNQCHEQQMHGPTVSLGAMGSDEIVPARNLNG